MNKPTPSQIEADKALLERFGGPVAVARLLRFTLPGGASRVNNWKARGIPAGVKLANPDLFLPQYRIKKQKGG